MQMFFRTVFLLTIASWLHVQCYVPIPSIQRKAELALQHYSSNKEHNSIIFSLLNVLVYDKRAKAFITDQAIEKCLEAIKKFDVNDEKILREFIYQGKHLSNTPKPSKHLKEDIQSALDVFFSNANTDDYDTFEILSNKKQS